MGKIRSRVSLQDVAEAAGVHVSTASLALRDDRRLTAATRERVKQAADRLGYRASPLVSAWLRQVRQPESAHPGVGLAFFLGLSANRQVASEPYYRAFVDGARAEAEALGYVVSETEFGEEDEKRLREEVSRLRYCGVRGVLLFDPARCLPPSIASELEAGFAVVVMLRCRGAERFHRVGPDTSANAVIALEHLRAMGCRRIGFPVPLQTNDALRKEVLAAYLLQQQQWPARDRVPLPTGPVEHSPERFLAWMKKHRPDAVLSVNIRIREYLLEAGLKIPEDVYYAHMGTDRRPGVAGVMNRGSDVGRAAVFHLAGLLSSNRLEVPEIPLVTLVPGVWQAQG